MHGLVLIFSTIGLLIPFEQNGRWGYRDGDGRVAIAARYEAAQEFSEQGVAAVADDQGWAYIDRYGRVVIRTLTVDNGPDEFQEDLARFRRAGKIGFFDRRGRIAIQPKYAWALPFSEGLAAVCEGCAEVPDGEHRAIKGGRWGFINRQGELVIALRFEETGSFEKGRARVRLGGRWHYVTRNGEPAPPL